MRVVIAEDSVLLRAGLVRLLRESGFDVVGEVGTQEGLEASVRRTRPDIAVVDVRLPPTQTDEGVRAAERIRTEQPDVGVLLLSQIVEPRRALALFRERPAGFGYLLKDRILDVEDFLGAVRRVAAGGTAIDPEVVSRLLGRLPDDDLVAALTPREREVLELMAEGRSNKAICAKLFLSVKTVETHVHGIFGKLELRPAPDDHRRVLAVLAYLESDARGQPAS